MPKKTSINSNWKNIFAEPRQGPKKEECYNDIPKPNVSGEGNFMAASTKYFAYAKEGGGGTICYELHNNPGRPRCQNKFNTGAGKIHDLDFSPFNPSQVCTGTDDSKIVICDLPDIGEESKEEKEATAPTAHKGHKKRVTLVRWHPTANGVLASTGWDMTVKVWDISGGVANSSFELDKKPFSLAWNTTGSLLAWTSQKKTLGVQDPRTEAPAHLLENFCGGNKASKVFWMDSKNLIGASCFTKQAKRTWKIWDARQMGDPLYDELIDQASSIMMPFYDEDNNKLYAFGRGDSTIQTWDMENDARVMWPSAPYSSNIPGAGGCMVPKRALDTSILEMARFMKLSNKEIKPIRFCLSRKDKGFDEENYPDSKLPLPCVTSTEYFAAEKELTVIKGSMDPEKRQDIAVVELEKKKTYQELEKENQDLNSKIAELEAKLAELEA